jgi:hypothetical protein
MIAGSGPITIKEDGRFAHEIIVNGKKSASVYRFAALVVGQTT